MTQTLGLRLRARSRKRFHPLLHKTYGSNESLMIAAATVFQSTRASRACVAIAVLAVTVAAGCAQPPVRRVPVLVEPLPSPAAGVATVPTAPPSSVTGTDPVEIVEAPRIQPPPPQAEVKIGTGQFINAQAAARRPASTAAGGNVVFNWENVPIQEVVKAILGDVLQENYVIAPGVQGNVTFSTAQPITPNQAMGVLEMLLSWNNATLVYRDGRYTVTPVASAVPGNLTPRIGPATSARGYELRVVPLKYISATEMEKILVPYIRPGAMVRVDNARNILVVGGTRADLTNYLETIAVFDVNWLKGMSIGIFPLEQVDAKTVVPELEKIFGDAAGTPMAGMFRFLAIERTNSVMVITPQPEYLTQAEEWIGKLDRGSGAASQLFVYYVKNVKATDLAEKLTDIFSSSGSGAAGAPAPIGAVTPGVASIEINAMNRGRKDERDLNQRARAVTQAPITTTPAGVAGTAGGSGEAGGGISIVESDNIRITSIEESNALLIKSTSSQYDSIESAIRRLDVVPLQVHIEARFLEVTLTDRFRFGVQSYFENLKLPGPRFADGVEHGAPTSFGGSITPAGVAWTFLSDHADFLIDTLQSEGVVEVLAAPSVVVLNNKSANINVGTQIPVVSSFINTGGGVVNPNDPNNPGINPGIGNSFVQFRDTGITLDVTPRVNPGGLVYLEIKQEKSTPGAADTAVAGNVAVNKRTLETEIAVQSGQTVMLGGLISDEADRFKGGVPVLSKIPVIGGLFGSTNRNRVRQELIVLITPTVIGSAQEGDELTREYRERFRQLKPLSDQVEAERLRGKARAEELRALDSVPPTP